MADLSKLQIRAKVLSVISEIKSLSTYNDDILHSFIDELSVIEDKKTLFDIYIKEFIKMDEKEYSFSSLLLKEIVPSDYITEKSLELLKSPALSDEYKYKLVQLLRLIGSFCDYTELPSYFDNPEDVLDKETKRLLETAVFNPESMLDFLDFVSAVSSRDRNLLLESLTADYQGDVLANIIYPILYSDFDKEIVLKVIDILSNSKSSLAIAPFNYLIETSDDANIVNACKIGLKKLKLSGASEMLAEQYFKKIVSNSMPAECFTTIPDGNGNQALLITRCNNESKYLLTAIVLNDKFGIVDCFGFYNISQEEIIKVIGKFYSSEGKYKVLPSYVKSRVLDAVNLTKLNKNKFPYEFICWYPVLCDIEPLGFNMEDYVASKCKVQSLSKVEVVNILSLDYTLRWFITPSENQVIKNWVDSIYSDENIQIESINNVIKTSFNDVFDVETTDLWKQRIFNLIYLLRNDNKLKDADIFYTMLMSDEYFNLFKIILIQRSIFSYFVNEKEKLRDTLFTTNIFRKRNMSDNDKDSKKIDKIIDLLQRNWLNG